MNFKTCGTCLNYRCVEEETCTGHMVPVEYCAVSDIRPCGYCWIACGDYDPDVEYIKFMEYDKDPDA